MYSLIFFIIKTSQLECKTPLKYSKQCIKETHPPLLYREMGNSPNGSIYVKRNTGTSGQEDSIKTMSTLALEQQ